MNIKNAKYVNIENTIVDVEIEHPQYGWIPYTFDTFNDTSDIGIEISEYLKTATVAVYVGKTAEEIRAEALIKINAEYEMAVTQLTAGVPHSEINTWTKQEIEARAYIQNNTVPTPLIDAIVVSRGVPKDILVNKIIEKADLYTTALGNLTGLRQKAEDTL